MGDSDVLRDRVVHEGTLRKAMVEVALGRLRESDLSGDFARAFEFPVGSATTELINILLERRRAFFQLRARPVPALWHIETIGDIGGDYTVERYTRDVEENAICDAIDFVNEYSDGGPLEGLRTVDTDVDTTVSAVRAASRAVSRALMTVEKVRARSTSAGRASPSALRALAALRAAQIGLSLFDQIAGLASVRDSELRRALTILEEVEPKIPRRVIARWISEVGLGSFSERTLNTEINRLRKKKVPLKRRKKHTVD